MAVRQEQLKALSDLVGNDHDLAVLRQMLVSQPGVLGGEALGSRVAELARQFQDELRGEAQPLGRLVYAEKPGAFTRRMGTYWAVRAREAEVGS